MLQASEKVKMTQTSLLQVKQPVSKSKHLFSILCVVSVISLLCTNLTVEDIDSFTDWLFPSETVVVHFSISSYKNWSDVLDDVATPNYDEIDLYQDPRDKRGLKKILLWNPFFNKPHYGAGFGTSAFVRTNCPSTCWVTNNPDELTTADAVVVHAYNMGPKFQNVTLPPRINQKQIFTFFILESPLKSYIGLRDVNFSFVDVFNLTMSYLNDPETDIRVPIGKVIRTNTSKKKIPRVRAIMKKRRSKGKFIVWFVSNCEVFSARNEYVQELQKYIPVDIYGECGTLSCPKDTTGCFGNISREYFFYLAFENSYCQDYITEKAFRTLTYRMVPIVLGGGNYRKDLPHKSFIDVRDYTSPKTLAKYLIYLIQNPEAYREFYLWRTAFTVASEQWSKTLGFCRLCEILHNETYPFKSNYNPLSYWDPDKWCLQNEAEQRALHLV